MSEAPWVEEEAGLYAEAAAEVYNRFLQPIDGVRGTWNWMLEPGNSGYGLMPFIVDVEWWDQVWSTWEVTKGDPTVLPALVEWSSPEMESFHHFDSPVPLVHLTGGSWPADDAEYAFSWMNFIPDEECSIAQQSLVAGIPVWSVTPIDEDTYNNWRQLFRDTWMRIDGYVISSIVADSEGYHSIFTDERGIDLDCDDHRFQIGPDGQPYGCLCGLEKQQQETYGAIYDGSLWPQVPEEFQSVWSWTIDRWVRGWNEIWRHQYQIKALGDNSCLSSWASSRSPYCRTLDSDDLTLEIERLSLIPSTNSQPSQESSTEPSPQLTLFDT